MANEITLNLKLSVAKTYLVHTENPGTQSVTMTGTNAVGGVQNIGTTAEVLVVSDVGTCGYAYFRNTDATTSVDIGTGTGTFVPFLRLKAGECAVCRLGTNAPTAKSVSATLTVNLQYFILTD